MDTLQSDSFLMDVIIPLIGFCTNKFRQLYCTLRLVKTHRDEKEDQEQELSESESFRKEIPSYPGLDIWQFRVLKGELVNQTHWNGKSGMTSTSLLRIEATAGKVRGGRWEEGKGRKNLPSSPARFLFLSLQSPHGTKRSPKKRKPATHCLLIVSLLTWTMQKKNKQTKKSSNVVLVKS